MGKSRHASRRRRPTCESPCGARSDVEAGPRVVGSKGQSPDARCTRRSKEENTEMKAMRIATEALAACAVAAFLAGCGSSVKLDEKQVPVESRTPGAGANAGAN